MKNISIVLGVFFIYCAVSVYVYNTSENSQKYYSLFARTLAWIVFDQTDPNSWYSSSNATISLTNPGSASTIQWSPVVIAPPPSRCTH